MITSQHTAPQFGYHRYGPTGTPRARYLLYGALGVGAGSLGLTAGIRAAPLIAGSMTGLIPGLDNYFLWKPTKNALFNFGVKYIATPLGIINMSNLIHQNRSKLWKIGKDIIDPKRIVVSATRHGDSRGGRGATTLSQRASRSVRPGNRRRRCTSRNKSGKTCLRPRNHSGRHRFV